MGSARHERLGDMPPAATRPAFPPVRLLHAVCAGFLALALAGCTAMDPDYARHEMAALTSTRGDEVVGVWVSKMTAVGFGQRRTLLLRPGGTGRLRVLTQGLATEEFEARWQHLGAGRWSGTLSQNGSVRFTFDLRTTGRELLYHVDNIANVHAVFVRADDENAVQTHLQRR